MPQKNIGDKLFDTFVSKPTLAVRKAVYGMTPNGFTDSEREEMNLPKYRKGNLPKGDSRLVKPIAEKINADRYYQYQQRDGKYPDDTNDTRDKRIDKYGKEAMENRNAGEYGKTALGGTQSNSASKDDRYRRGMNIKK
jgi:hypothetical protein